MFEKEYFDNFYNSNLSPEDYNLDIKEKEEFQDNYFNIFNPEFTTHDEFLENFMRIDYNTSIVNSMSVVKETGNDSLSTHSSMHKNIQNNSIDNPYVSTESVKFEQNVEVSDFIKHKKGRPMTDTNRIFDEVNNVMYDPNEDSAEYKKARKRMQNRESAVRSRQKKKESTVIRDSEVEYLRMENYRLYHENKMIQREKNFLIDQIKFMQNLIKSNNVNVKPCVDCKDDIEKNISSSSPDESPKLVGGRQRQFGKVFSVFLVCVLSLAYVSYDNSNSEFNTGEKIVFSSGSTMTLNDASERQQELHKGKFISHWSSFVFILLCGFVTWNITAIISYILNVFRKQEKFSKKL